MGEQTWRDIYFTSRDGLRLHARHYPAPGSARRPLVCLPGLTRNARDFHVLARWLPNPNRHRRAVYAIDYRGRGLSEHDPDWKNYTPYIESLDLLDLMAREELHDVALLGTSRGGIIAMILAALRPAAFGVAILNDIGPIIERDGIARIVGYVGRTPLPPDWEDATRLIKDMNRADFPVVRDEEWSEVARQWFNDENGLPSSSYDPALAKSFSNVSGDTDLPPMWEQFQALATRPTLAIRGENSDILSAATLAEMQARQPDMKALTIDGQGHAPLLRDQPTIMAIEDFLAETDATAQANIAS